MTRAVTLLLYDLTLVILAIEDLQVQKIRNRYPAVILLLSLLGVFTMPEIAVCERVLGMFLVSVPMLFIRILIPGSFGGGDIKLVFACGAFLGDLVLEGTVIAVLSAGFYVLCLMVRYKGWCDRRLAFGPFLAIGFLMIQKNL